MAASQIAGKPHSRGEDSKPVVQSATEAAVDWPWPFSQADLSAGLRRYYNDPSAWVGKVQPGAVPGPAPGGGPRGGRLAGAESPPPAAAAGALDGGGL